MKKTFFIAASIMLVAAGCSKTPSQPNQEQNQNPPQNQQATSTPSDMSNWNSYTSPTKYGFSIKYPPEFGFNTDYSKVQGLAYIPVCDQNMVACAFLSRDKYPNTNFDGAGVSINIDPSLNSETKCYNFNVATNAAQKPGEDVTINGVVFKTATGGDAGAGHFDNVKVYRNFHNNTCYEIATHVGSTDIGNYPEGTVTQFDENAVWGKLQSVVDTFNFTTPISGSSSGQMQIVVTGTTVCLPHKNAAPGQPQTMECAIGLKDDSSGKYYSLKNSNPPMYDTNVKVTVTGTLSDDSSSNYDTAGAINVNSIDRQAK